MFLKVCIYKIYYFNLVLLLKLFLAYKKVFVLFNILFKLFFQVKVYELFAGATPNDYFLNIKIKPAFVTLRNKRLGAS